MTNADNEEAMAEYNAWRQSQGLKTFVEAPPVPDGVKTPKRPHFLQLTEECWTGLQVQAHEHGYNSVTSFIEAIGTRKWPD